MRPGIVNRRVLGRPPRLRSRSRVSEARLEGTDPDRAKTEANDEPSVAETYFNWHPRH